MLELLHGTQSSVVLLAALLVLAHLGLECSHTAHHLRLLLAHTLPFGTAQLAPHLRLHLCHALALRGTHLGSHLMLELLHGTQSSVVLLAALLVLAHLGLECCHATMVSTKLGIHDVLLGTAQLAS